MDVLIVICLLLIIALLAGDKIVIKKVVKGHGSKANAEREAPDIMGRAKEPERQSAPTNTLAGQAAIQRRLEDNFDSKAKDRVPGGVAPQEEPDEAEDEAVDLSEEEKGWEPAIPNGDDGFASGATFEELSSLGKVLQLNSADPVLVRRAAGVVLKIQGTELFGLLESAMADASPKIARLLDRQMMQRVDSGSSDSRGKSMEDFDIGEFV